MKKVSCLFALSGITMIGLMIVSCQNQGVQAQTLDPNGPQAIVGLQNITMEPSKAVPMPANATVTPDHPLEDIEQKSLTVLLDELKSKALGNDPSRQSGWYLLKWAENDDFDAKNNGVLPNGQEIPKQYIQELWCYVDANGMVTQRVTLMKTLQGTIFQSSASNGQRGWNSATGEKLSGRIYPFSDLLIGAHKSVAQDAQLSPAAVQTIRLNGKELIKISFTEKYVEPLKLNNFDKKVTRSEKAYYFDPETGFATRDETLSIFVDGTQRIGIRNEWITIEAVAGPSEEALKFLKELETK